MSNSYMLAQSAYIGNHNISPSKSDGTRLNQSVASSRNRALSISTVLEPSTGRTLINLPFLTYSRNHDDTLEYDNEDDEWSEQWRNYQLNTTIHTSKHSFLPPPPFIICCFQLDLLLI